MEVNFKSFIAFEESINVLIHNLEKEIEEVELILVKLNSISEMNHEKTDLRKALNELSANRESLKSLVNLIAKTHYKYCFCEKKLLSMNHRIDSHVYCNKAILYKTNRKIDGLLNDWEFVFSLKDEK